jgi:hypothetical protein
MGICGVYQDRQMKEAKYKDAERYRVAFGTS